MPAVAARRAVRVTLVAALVATLVGVGIIEVAQATDRTGPLALHVTALVILGAAVVVQPGRPLAAALVGSGAVTAQCFLGWAGSAAELVLFLALVFRTANQAHGRRRSSSMAVLAVGYVVVLLRDPTTVTLAGALPSLVLFAAAAAIGLTVHQRAAIAAADLEAARRAHEEQEVRAVEALEQERTRLARELHDVVTHSLCVVVVQAGAMRLDASAEQAERLTALEETARGALLEMRRLLGLLRGEPGGTLGPQPGVAQVPDLLDRLRAAGLEASLEVTGHGGPLAPGVDLAAYRIVQEATTNVLTHASARRVVVALDWQLDRLVLRVTDDGRPGADEPREGGGRGLLGLSERTALYGGVLQHGPTSGGGYQVCAELPLVESLDPASP